MTKQEMLKEVKLKYKIKLPETETWADYERSWKIKNYVNEYDRHVKECTWLNNFMFWLKSND